jgi:hypothetical protein
VVPRSSPRGNELPGSGVPAYSRQPDHHRSQFVPRRSGKLRKAQLRRLDRPSRAGGPGTSMKTSKTSAKRRTRRSPMLAHETSLVSGASVVGMTLGAYHEPGNMPAGVPGNPTASARGDRLHPAGPAAPAAGRRLHRGGLEPGDGDKSLNGCLAKSRTVPTRPAEARDKSDERHGHDRPMRDRSPFPTMGSEAKEREYALRMPAQGKGTL